MRIVTRFILVIALIAQSLPGLGAMRCAGMGERAVMRMAESPANLCPCCTGTESDVAAACECGQAKEGQMPPTPADIKVAPVEQMLVSLPVLLGDAAVTADASASVRANEDTRPRMAAGSAQSLLCVWVM